MDRSEGWYILLSNKSKHWDVCYKATTFWVSVDVIR